MALQAILDAFLRKELAAWAKHFQTNFTRTFSGCADRSGRGGQESTSSGRAYAKDVVYASWPRTFSKNSAARSDRRRSP